MKKLLMLVLVGVLLISSVVVADEYVVQEGDVLWKIAKDHNTTVGKIVELNELENGNKIYVDQVLQLDEEAELSNKEKAIALIESIGTTNTKPAGYVNPTKYIQHNLGVADGLAGFGAVLAVLPEGSYGKNIRAFEDGDYVFMHNEYDFFGPKVGIDVFRFEDGLIVEHWDNLTPIAEDVNVSGRGQLDGTTVLRDLDQTEANRTLVSNLLRDVFLGAAPEKITDYISTDHYFQHNTGVADDLDGLGAALQGLAEAGTPMIYEENHFVLAEGNFVLAMSEGQFLGEHVAFYDIFRVEDGKVVEHWDTIETIPAEADWANDNGKF